MRRLVITLEGRAEVLRNGQHSGMLTGAIVLQDAGRLLLPGEFARDFDAKRLMHAALERVFTQADLLQHRLDSFDMNRFATVRSAGDGNLLVSKAKPIGGA